MRNTNKLLVRSVGIAPDVIARNTLTTRIHFAPDAKFEINYSNSCARWCCMELKKVDKFGCVKLPENLRAPENLYVNVRLLKLSHDW